MLSNTSNESCSAVTYKGNTTIFNDQYNGMPDTLIINLVVFVVLLLLFTILRKIAWDYGRLALVNRTEEKWTSLFFGDRDRSTQGSQESLDTTVTSQDKGIFRWIVAFWKLRDVDILNKCGKDAIQYLSFQRYLLIYLAIITVLSVGVILPINFQGDLLGTAMDFGHTTIGNLDPGNPILWVHAVMAVLYLVIVIILLRHFHLNLDVEEDEQVKSAVPPLVILETFE